MTPYPSLPAGRNRTGAWTRLLAFLFAACAAPLALPGSEPAPPRGFAGFQALDPALLPALEPVPSVPGRPRVLLLGDSISIAYTLAVRAHLEGRATVHRPPENCGSTAYGLERLADWLGTGPWAVIHFNFGLHDLKYLDAQGNYVSPAEGRQVASPEEYGRNLRALVRRLRATGAALIFATTTPVPAGTKGRVEGGEAAYNEVALAVMREAGVTVDDLHAFVRGRLAGLQLPHNVHFTPAGSDELAREVARHITAALDHELPRHH
ncbi:MAG: SGNH/GDSL hydrolase family protein [Opitutaceae bacterium]|nr:SGNH/GDSL hydrolase family protein [Opitutaceae bacterium]